MTSVVLMDIEGTTTAIDFVHKVLFPYARKQMREFLGKNVTETSVRACLDEARQTLKEEQGIEADNNAITLALEEWIDNDRKHPALKRLQGMMWKRGYEEGDYTAHLYEDVLPAWKRWLEKGLQLAIYSSGSVQAQKLLFGYTEYGDLNPHLSAYFDTGVGHKREADSYRRITKELKVPAEDILFLSDVPQELDAAKTAGLETIQLVRPGTEACHTHRTETDFATIL